MSHYLIFCVLLSMGIGGGLWLSGFRPQEVLDPLVENRVRKSVGLGPVYEPWHVVGYLLYAVTGLALLPFTVGMSMKEIILFGAVGGFVGHVCVRGPDLYYDLTHSWPKNIPCPRHIVRAMARHREHQIYMKIRAGTATPAEIQENEERLERTEPYRRFLREQRGY